MYYRRGIDDSEFVSQAVTREPARIDAAITKFLLDRVWWKGGRQVCPVCDNVFGKIGLALAASGARHAALPVSLRIARSTLRSATAAMVCDGFTPVAAGSAPPSST
jgi:hypothetical protein